MVAVLTVFANHLWDSPSGGFVGVDVFFVISGFLITSNLLRTAETHGNVSFKTFYWNRVRRIVPAATVVLALTCIAAYLVFLPFRAREVNVDAFFAFFFISNWWFAYENTDYFRATANAVSPVQHYWSLSIEEQFYFVWPAVIFLIGVVVARRGMTHANRMLLVASSMCVIIAVSLGWALYQTAASPITAYFNTGARVWELGTGALLATMVGVLARVPTYLRPVLSWVGLAFIAVSLVVIGDHTAGFPAPWALLPVAGAALVIAAGVGSEPKYQALLRNPISGYIGDISYSLYLVHWPVIVILGTVMESGWHYYVVAVTLSFGLAIASYHFVENPLRHADWSRFRLGLYHLRRRRFEGSPSSAYAATGALALVVLALTLFALRPEAYEQTAPPPLAALAQQDIATPGVDQELGPRATALQNEIASALHATDWPSLSPSFEAEISGPQVAPDLALCGRGAVPDSDRCTWGSDSAPLKVVVVGDSLALGYVEPLRQIALRSEGRIQVHSEAMLACAFADDLIERESLAAECPARKQHAVDFINATKPDMVFVTNSYLPSRIVGTEDALTPGEWYGSLDRIIKKFSSSTKKVALVSPPPADASISECYGTKSSAPADCISEVTEQWSKIAFAEQDLAQAIGGVWIDSRPWFCTANGLCPSFVGSVPTKHDDAHMSSAYGHAISPVIAESLNRAGLI